MIKADKIIHKYCLVLVTLIIYACQAENKSADIYSYQIDDKTEKIETLKKYLTKESGLIEAEYHIWFQDNGTGRIPGPSDYNIKLALKVEPDSLDSWTNYLDRSSKKISIDLWDELQLDKNFWKLESEPELYHSSLSTEVKLLFRKENIILCIYSTMPVALEYLDE
ncbi:MULTISPECIES: hypothetical protein [Zobellia]|uniref:Lipoprotein n=1 Tax=Zobellia galactanivorans (strain DSM 12802 / CCUG 47099 / CIP 106680 / NCIMB 13871 / Dsij) TaxID=63186 RepID=G0L8D1_ZOBGA|nr:MULTISPECIES: hypothetical protein [Zobellia]OWW23336.1 hypothetical protein B4Q04_21065 [Zobellia sp. OII3]CAZ97466.1 Hypothetical protein ZOBELLIA_3328 [Zobellia galactanivorans]